MGSPTACAARRGRSARSLRGAVPAVVRAGLAVADIAAIAVDRGELVMLDRGGAITRAPLAEVAP